MTKINSFFSLNFHKLLLAVYFGLSFFLLARPVSAQNRTFGTLVNDQIIPVLTAIIPLLTALAVVTVLVGSFLFIKTEGDKRNEYKDMIVYGIIGLFVMVSVWGLVNLLGGTFDLNNSSIKEPKVEFKPPTGVTP